MKPEPSIQGQDGSGDQVSSGLPGHSEAVSGPKTYELAVVGWNGTPVHCVYLNDYRVAGGKPWGGSETYRGWQISMKDIESAIPEVAKVRSAAKALIDRDCQYAGANVVIPCADHAEAMRLVRELRAAIADTSEPNDRTREVPKPNPPVSGGQGS